MEVEARGKRRTVYLTDNLWRLTRSWAIANDQTVSEVVEQTLLSALAGEVAPAMKLRPTIIPADTTLTEVKPGPGYGNSAIQETPPRFRPAPKPGPRKRR